MVASTTTTGRAGEQRGRRSKGNIQCTDKIRTWRREKEAESQLKVKQGEASKNIYSCIKLDRGKDLIGKGFERNFDGSETQEEIQNRE